MTFKTLNDLYNHFPWKTPNKFIPLAKKHGFTEDAARKYLHNLIHDVKVPKAQFMNIYSKHSNGFQMDPFINDKTKNGLNYLMLININTRKAYCYPMKGKGAKEVFGALHKFIKDEPDIYSITSDQDAAYLSNDVLTFMKSTHTHNEELHFRGASPLFRSVLLQLRATMLIAPSGLPRSCMHIVKGSLYGRHLRD